MVGRDSSQTEFNAVGETGGEKTHTMLLAELAAHTHTITVDGNGGTTGSRINAGSASTSNTAVTNSTGSATPFNVLQPYISLNYIIKT